MKKTLIFLITIMSLNANEMVLPTINSELMPDKYVTSISSKKPTQEELNLKEKNKLKKEKEIFENWVKNPLSCFSSIAGITFPKCMDKKNPDMSVCQTETIKVINKLCTSPILISITKQYEKENNIKIDLKSKTQSKEFKKYISERFKSFRDQMYFFVGYKAGYYFARNDYKNISKKMKVKKYENEKKEK